MYVKKEPTPKGQEKQWKLVHVSKFTRGDDGTNKHCLPNVTTHITPHEGLIT